MIKVFIVDDHEVVRLGLRALLEQGGLTVVGEAATAAEAVEQALLLKPQVVLMDVRLPDESGIAACRRIRARDEDIHVLMLTSYSDEEAVFASIMAGASGYLLKKIDAQNLLNAVAAVAEGKSLLDPEASKSVMDRMRALYGGQKAEPGLADLTHREGEILELIAGGLTNKEIADRIYLSEKTVRNYVSAILTKLGLSHRTQAALYFLEHKPGDV